MKILGVDPGYDRCGIAVIERLQGTSDRVIDSTCITTDAQKNFEERVLAVVGGVSKWVGEYSPDVCALERLYFTKNQKTAMRVAETRGAILATIAQFGIPIHEFGPGEIKVAITGNGRASKAQVVRMVTLISGMKKNKAFDDEYDAVAVALTASAVLRP